MSDCESISGDEIPDAESDSEYQPGNHTIPLHHLHPLVRECGGGILTQENQKTFNQTPERCMKAFKMCPGVITDYIDTKNITREMVEYLDTLPEGDRRFIKRMFNQERIRHCMSLMG